MKTDAFENWRRANGRFLQAALERLRARLGAHGDKSGLSPEKPDKPDDEVADGPVEEARAAMPSPPALDSLAGAFRLSPFETEILLLCAAVEIDSGFAELCSRAQGDSQRIYPTFSLALAALPGPSWSALSPIAPLRAWHLVEPTEQAPRLLTTVPLRIDESILHYLLGHPHVDERLAAMISPVLPPCTLPPSHEELARRMAAVWFGERHAGAETVVQLCGDEAAGKHDTAAAACALLGVNLKAVAAVALPTAPAELELIMRLCEREVLLANAALLLDADEIEGGDPAREYAIQTFVERARCPLIVSTRRRRPARKRQEVVFDAARPTLAEQRSLWAGLVCRKGKRMDEEINRLVMQFDMPASAIHATWHGALAHHGQVLAAAAPEELGAALWDTCRRQTRSRLEHLSQRLKPNARWDDLVLPTAQRHVLDLIVTQVRQRARVYGEWGFLQKGDRGLGIAALFAGASGTGKTMAAEVLAHRLGLDLYRVDLSAVVSKFIGETEKNLRLIFDGAEEGGSILLFDEADALFGKRSEVKDSHDRHANVEVSYLLQRLEAYRGLAVLTTNFKEALDQAFLRRLRFIVHFPFPDAAEREIIWQRIFPPGTPTHGLDFRKLARLNVSGGNIRGIALQAAFLAAQADEAVTMRHLEEATRHEFARVEKLITETEIRGWTS